ncbi:hypothetical protein M407DRAFT_24324 [Tulasnella calospora MUT 4182]|uniref:Uncharacterized protein n=1 Tax=Tulasnella calospora MUT 4182 TaxID=1051891 RepID=A0A0C3KYB9_9AGAM|nr:hypothetical protein M407DRAFT_24324 [Tulasnella calospora MUT 4182]
MDYRPPPDALGSLKLRDQASPFLSTYNRNETNSKNAHGTLQPKGIFYFLVITVPSLFLCYSQAVRCPEDSGSPSRSDTTAFSSSNSVGLLFRCLNSAEGRSNPLHPEFLCSFSHLVETDACASSRSNPSLPAFNHTCPLDQQSADE